ncbi:TauD/TfdA family dioxygenase [Streptosporangium sp. NPDC001559]|uniref:TauD/TfdA family dioxygenase n=1 Tax=Streptosporangium sp. NPDC001559 TaxID=3366187 RepID=UPI0036EC2A27
MRSTPEGTTGELDWEVSEGKPVSAWLTGPDDIAGTCDRLAALLPELRAALAEHGAVHLRGLPLKGVDDFARVRDVLIPRHTPYREKATPRSDLGSGVFSSTDLPPSQPIMMHNENSYTLTFPGLLLFACLTAPEEGGATPVADCRKVLRNVPAPLAEKVRASGWLLRRGYSEHISTDWRTAFSAQDRGDVERYCADNLIGHRWQDDGNLRTSQLRPGVIRHPRSGEEVWFNHLAFWNEWSLDEELREVLVEEFGRDGLPFNTAFGDGEPLTRDDLEDLRAAYEAATVRERWRPGDLLIVDNVLTAHGRDPFRGDRRIVVAMGEPVDLLDCAPTVQPAAGQL